MNEQHRWEIGQTVPLTHDRRPFGAQTAATWYVLTTGRQRRDMVAAQAWLTRAGATDAWFPEEQFRRCVKRNRTKVWEDFERAIVPGIVFMLADRAPQWDVLADRKRIRPLKVGENPVCVTEAIMSKMQRVPTRIEELRRAAEAAERAAREAKAPRAGESARFVSGPFAGKVVRVDSISGGCAVVMIDSMKVRAEVSGLERTA